MKRTIPSGIRMIVKQKMTARKKRMSASGTLTKSQNPVRRSPPVMVKPIQSRSESTAKTIKQSRNMIMKATSYI